MSDMVFQVSMGARTALCGVAAALLILFSTAAFQPAAGQDLLRAILESGELRLGVRTDAAPFSALVEDRAEGFSVELCERVAEALIAQVAPQPLAVRYRPVGTGERFDTLVTGHIDLLCGATTATLTRREKVAFSIPIYVTGIGALARPGFDPATLDAVETVGTGGQPTPALAARLAGLRVGMRRDTTASDWLAAGPLTPVLDVAPTAFETHVSALEDLRAGRIDLYFADRALLRGLLVRWKDGAGAPALSGAAFTVEPYALALPRGAENLRLTVDRVLSALYRSGEIVALHERHLGPVSPETLALYRAVALPE